MPRIAGSSPPKYRRHKASGQAVVTIAGRECYLGLWKSKASKVEYDRLIGEWLAAGRPTTPVRSNELTIVEVIVRYLRFAKEHYVKDGRPTGEAQNIQQAIRPLKELYGRTPAGELGPLAFKSVRQRLVDSGLSRGCVNNNMGRIRRMFKWAASEELLSESVWRSLCTVEGLRAGKTKAREPAPILPVDEATVAATLPYLPLIVADMVRLQRLTGCRPGEVCMMRPCDVDRSGEVWSYVPANHKTEHHGRERVIFIGPQGQNVLRPYLLRGEANYCFVPAESERKRRGEVHDRRVTPLCCGNRPGTNRKLKPNRSPGERYTPSSYRRAISYGCEKAGIETWSPNRLRHAAATEIRRRFGLEAAQVTLGHSKADITQIYAERDLAKAAAVMREVG